MSNCIMSEDSRKALFGTLRDRKIASEATDRDARLFVASRALNRRVRSFTEINDAEAAHIIRFVETHFRLRFEAHH